MVSQALLARFSQNVFASINLKEHLDIYVNKLILTYFYLNFQRLEIFKSSVLRNSTDLLNVIKSIYFPMSFIISHNYIELYVCSCINKESPETSITNVIFLIEFSLEEIWRNSFLNSLVLWHWVHNLKIYNVKTTVYFIFFFSMRKSLFI